MKTNDNMTANNGKIADFLIETAGLEQALEGHNLRIFDCAVKAGPNPDTKRAKSFPFVFETGRDGFNAGHIPSAGYMDILDDISDKDSPLPLMVPPLQQFVEAMRRYGISNNSRVVLYSSTEPMWAARVWWMLRAFGFNGAIILNGGIAKWIHEGRPVSQADCAYAPGDFTANFQPGMFSDKAGVLNAIESTDTCVINALPPMMHTGNGGPVFGRKGRIKGSMNVPNSMLHDPDSGCYLPPEKLRDVFRTASTESSIITYCGGGIASSNNAFALTMLGHENVSVYDASMFEWGNDPSLPMEAGNTVENQ